MRKYLKFIALTLFAALVVVWFGRDLEWAKVWTALKSSDWRLIGVAVAIICVTYMLRAYRWRALLAPLARGASLRELFAATVIGYGAIFLLGRAGEVARPAFLPLRERRVRPAAAFVTIAVERLYDMVAVVLMFAANLLILRMPAGGDAVLYSRVREAGVLMLGASVLGIAALVLFRLYAGRVTGWLGRAFERAPSLVRRAGKLLTHLLEQLAGALGVLVDARELLVTVGWTAVLWAAVTLANLLVLRAFRLPYGASETIFVMGWSLVGSLVPTPGGAAGTYHVATAKGLEFLGTARHDALAVSIVLHLVVFGPALFIGLYYFLRSDVSLARLRAPADAGSEASASEARPVAHLTS
ncbi:MAG TPA: lysylphosphatidylglycerol synthase transmembrane domain-containing protein [Pyrinomonadaceae bacterium]|nr:lysylphosphatidylglycerol synthase transmembrane domain-containing protein [Pyrinomonadaceae bacterium]